MSSQPHVLLPTDPASLVTLFLYMVAELSALQQIVNSLTGLDGLPVVIVQVIVTTIYTSIGGFKVSFITDTVQGIMVVLLIVVGSIAIGATTSVDRSLIPSSNLTKPSLLGWQLIYILPIAITTNDFLLSSLWLRTFASKTDRDLRLGVSLAVLAVAIILTFVGSSGLLAVWSGAVTDPATEGSIAFFLLLAKLPGWVVGFILIMVVTLSTAAFDSFQSAMVSTGSNDLFRNRLNFWIVRFAVVLVIIPVVVVALKSPSVLRIFLISDMLSATFIPVLVIGLSERTWWWKGFDVVVGGLGGILTVFLFGLVYYKGDAHAAGGLILLENGLLVEDWSVFGAFVAAPVGALLWGFVACAGRIVVQVALARVRGQRSTALERPVKGSPIEGVGGEEGGLSRGRDDWNLKRKFF